MHFRTIKKTRGWTATVLLVVAGWAALVGSSADGSSAAANQVGAGQDRAGSSITGTVWHDQVRDGFFNHALEPPASGVMVELRRDGEVVDRTVSTPTGSYRFDELEAGSYRVRFVVSSASTFTAASALFGAGSSVDADGYSEEIAVGDAVARVSAGIVPWTGTVGARLWDDVDANGVFDSSEWPIAGQTVHLIGDDGVIVARTTTGSSGEAQLGAPAGTYRLRVLYGGFNQGGENNVSDEGFSEPFTITRANPREVVNAAGAAAGSGTLAVYGKVRIDENRDGVIEPGSKVPSIEVALFRHDEAIPLATTTTDGEGEYRFEGLDPGWGYVYRVGFTAPVGYRFQPNNWADRFDERTVNRAETPRVQTVLVVGENGYGVIGNRIWADNGDGIQTPTCDDWEHEPGLAGIEVMLYSAREGQEPELLTTTTTSRDGRYVFFGYFTLDPYLIEVAAPPGAFFAPQHVGEDDEIDSDVDDTGRSASFTLEEIREISDLDIGIVFPDEAELGARRVGDRVWLDDDGDGIQDRDEAGVAGVTVELYAQVDEARRDIVDVTRTRGDGSYELVAPLDLSVYPFEQQYLIQVVAPPGYGFTSSVGSNDRERDDNSDVDARGLSLPFEIGCRERIATLDAGLVPAGS